MASEEKIGRKLIIRNVYSRDDPVFRLEGKKKRKEMKHRHAQARKGQLEGPPTPAKLI